MVIFGVGNSSLRHSENWKNSFSVLGAGPNDDINDNVVESKKTLVLILVIHNQNFVHVYITIVVKAIFHQWNRVNLRLLIIYLLTICYRNCI